MTFFKLLILLSLASFWSLPQSLSGDGGDMKGRQEAMAKAGFATLASQTTASFGRTGNPLQAVQAPFQKENLQALAINVATAGLMEKFGPPSIKALLEANKTPVFSDFVRYNGARSAFNTGLTMTLTGKPLDKALKEGGVQFIGNTLGGYGSYQIGQHYGPLNLDGTPKESGLSYGEHKLLHGLVGGLTGGILNASKSSKEIQQGMLSGATGAMAAEVVGESLIPIKDQAFIQKKTQDIVQEEIKKTGQMPSDKRFDELFSKEVERCQDLAKIIGASTGAFIGKDANTAYWASSNAVENNMAQAISFGRTVWRLYKVGQGLEKGSKAFTQTGKQAPSTTGGPGLEPEKDPKKEGEQKSEAERKIPPQTKSYIREIEKRTDTKISDAQKDHLAQDLRQNNYKKLEKPEYNAHTEKFNKSVKNDLIAQWEQNTGQKWPTYKVMDPKTGLQKINPKTGELQVERYQAHHINPQQLGGKHEWWNVYPVHPNAHQGGLHGSGSALNQIVKGLKK